MSERARELLYCWSLTTLDVLVPKKRGEGFLVQPLGHHVDAGLLHIESELKCDIYGLDGYLEIHCGMGVAVYDDRRTEFAARAMALLSAHYGVPHREIPRDELYDIMAAQIEKRRKINLGVSSLQPVPKR